MIETHALSADESACCERWMTEDRSRTVKHVQYPHEPGYLYDCPACEAQCHCTTGNAECIFDGEHKPTGDSAGIAVECSVAQELGVEISDGCARAIASQYHDAQLGLAFVTTGAIIGDPSLVWRELYSIGNGRSIYGSLSAADKLAADMLGTYLTQAGERGPVAGWSALWVR